MNNRKKLARLFRSAAERIGRGENDSPEEQITLRVLRRALAGRRMAQGAESQPQSSRPERLFRKRNLTWVGVAAAVLVLLVVTAKVFLRPPPAVAYAAEAAREGNLAWLLTFTQTFESRKVTLEPLLAQVVERLGDPDDALLRTIQGELSKGDAFAALAAAAERITASRKAKEEGRPDAVEDPQIEGLLTRYLLRHTHAEKASEPLRAYALILIMKIFLENPIDTVGEIEDSRDFRERLEAMVTEPSEKGGRPEFLYAISALSCCGSFRSAERLAERLSRAEVGSEERRLLLFSLERIYRRSYSCTQVDDLGRGPTWLRGVLVQAVSNPSVGEEGEGVIGHLRGLLAFEESFLAGEAVGAALRERYHDSDALDPASHLGVTFTEEESTERELTALDSQPAGEKVLAEWDFSYGRFTHRGAAKPARGILVQPFKEPDANTGHLRLNVFGRSKLVLAFRLDDIPKEGVTLRLRELAASRNYFAYQGSAQFTLLLDGRTLAENLSVTRHGRGDWDSFRIARNYLWRGEHEFTILLSAESTTTYWLYEAKIEID